MHSTVADRDTHPDVEGAEMRNGAKFVGTVSTVKWPRYLCQTYIIGPRSPPQLSTNRG